MPGRGEAKRLYDARRNRTYGLADPRENVGVVLMRATASEDAEAAIALAKFTGRDWIEMALAAAGLGVVAALLGPWFWLGLQGIAERVVMYWR